MKRKTVIISVVAAVAVLILAVLAFCLNSSVKIADAMELDKLGASSWYVTISSDENDPEAYELSKDDISHIINLMKEAKVRQNGKYVLAEYGENAGGSLISVRCGSDKEFHIKENGELLYENTVYTGDEDTIGEIFAYISDAIKNQ